MRLTAGWVTLSSAAAAVKLPLRAAASKTNRAWLEGSMRRRSGITSDYAFGENLAIARLGQGRLRHAASGIDDAHRSAAIGLTGKILGQGRRERRHPVREQALRCGLRPR